MTYNEIKNKIVNKKDDSNKNINIDISNISFSEKITTVPLSKQINRTNSFESTRSMPNISQLSDSNNKQIKENEKIKLSVVSRKYATDSHLLPIKNKNKNKSQNNHQNQNQNQNQTQTRIVDNTNLDFIKNINNRPISKSLTLENISKNEIFFPSEKLPDTPNVRDSIRILNAYSRRDPPKECIMKSLVFIKKKEFILSMDSNYIEWHKNNKLYCKIDTDDIIGADKIEKKLNCFKIHVFHKKKGKKENSLKRKYKIYYFRVFSEDLCQRWITGIQELVCWQARIPNHSITKRKIKIVINPHSGKRRAKAIYNEQVKPFFEIAKFQQDIEYTTCSGHALEMGKNYSVKDGYEAIVFVSGDGTICEYMNGLLSRNENEWKDVVRTTPISLISAGTQNGFSIGIGLPTIISAIYCIIKRKMRPLDVVTVKSENEPEKIHYSCCGLGWGVAGDIAAESERYRSLGTKRYAFLKLKYGFFFPKKHSGKIRYVPIEPQPILKKYFDIRDEGAVDQYIIEQDSIYDELTPINIREKKWKNVIGAVRNPADENRLTNWSEENGKFMVVGILNVVPDALYGHPSDGALDLIITKKGNFLKSLQLGILYLFGKELKSPLIQYIKAKAVIIEQNEKEECLNMDGEVLKGPGPWKMEIVPSLFKVLSEK